VCHFEKVHTYLFAFFVPLIRLLAYQIPLLVDSLLELLYGLAVGPCVICRESPP